MDDFQHRLLEAQLLGTSIGGWRIDSSINHGKSASVFLASRDEMNAAVKVFDPQLVHRFGEASQLQRIERELELVGLQHPNLVEILDGGKDPDRGFLFVVMEYLPWDNLATQLAAVPRVEISGLITKLAGAAKFLEDRGLCHRDIKPENIAVSSDFQKLKLLDLGVLRPLSSSSLTDSSSERSFISTLRYSSPKYQIRGEDDGPAALQALTFYQIGAVLHDLIEREPLFAEFSEPYTRLVLAVQSEPPRFSRAKEVPQSLVRLARNCLNKSDQARLQLVTWEHLLAPLDSPAASWCAPLALRKVVAGRPRDASFETLLKAYCDSLARNLRAALIDQPDFPPVSIRVVTRTWDAWLEIDLEFSRYDGQILPSPLRMIVEVLVDLTALAPPLASIGIGVSISPTSEARQAPRPIYTVASGVTAEEALQVVRIAFLQALSSVVSFETVAGNSWYVCLREDGGMSGDA